MSQRVQLLHILREFCILTGYNTELLIGDMSDTEKNDAIILVLCDPESHIIRIEGALDEVYVDELKNADNLVGERERIIIVLLREGLK